jgi:ribosome maturation factor RimP
MYNDIEESDANSGRKPTFLLAGTMKEAVVDRITDIAQRVAGPEGLEVLEVQLLGGGAHRLLRIFIDKPSGVTHADCEFISQNVGTILDVEDIVPGGSYTLEVSSPGVERKLTRPKDFERFKGQKARVLLREPVENQRRWEGVLAGFADGVVTLDIGPARSVRFDLDKIERANLKFEW